MTGLGRTVSVCGIVLLLLFAQAGGLPLLATPAHAEDDPAFGSIEGVIVDNATGSPISFVDVVLDEGGIGRTADIRGRFSFRDVPPGTHRLRFLRVGYRVLNRDVVVEAGRSARVTARMVDTPHNLERIEVEGEHEIIRIAPEQKPVVVDATELNRHMESTVAGTLAEEPGMAERSLGAAPSRPVVRGLGGQRLLVLQDGQATGDLSATSDDHAVAIEPLHAERIDVVRGPAAFVYGSSVLGGIVDVKQNELKRERLTAWHGTVGFQGQTVNRGTAEHLAVRGPVGVFGLHLSGSRRDAGDLSTAGGRLDNSDLRNWNGSAGLSFAGNRTILTGAVSYYDSEYGVPGGFEGGHEDGVDIALDRRRYEARGEIDLGRGLFRRVELQGTYSRYYHEELESDDVCGISFGLLTTQLRSNLHFANPVLGNGLVGVSFENRDRASGCLSFLPRTDETTLSGFVYDNLHWGEWDLHMALRADAREVEPEEADSNKAGLIRRRDFSGVSGGAAAYRNVFGTKVGLTLMRSFRAPGIEELFSEGPHLAAYSYEVGNADLGEETGVGAELSGRYEGARITIRGAIFENRFEDYIFQQDTGEFEVGVGEGGKLARYQYEGLDAVLRGGELSCEYRATPGFSLRGQASYIRGQLVDEDVPLPRIPPLSGRLSAEYRSGAWTLGLSGKGGAAQERLGAFEERTASYATVDAFAEWLRLAGRTIHTVTLRLENLTDAEYRNHLSRTKSIRPEPGINLSIFYRIHF